MISDDVETQALAESLCNPGFAVRLVTELSRDAFRRPRLRALFQLMADVHASGLEINLETVCNRYLNSHVGGGLTAVQMHNIANQRAENLDGEQALRRLSARIPKKREPVDLTFPQLAIRGAAEQFADLYASRLESPWAFFAFGFLTYLGAIVSDKVRLRSALDVQPRLFTVLLGESSDPRKSECQKQVSAFFRRNDLLGDLSVCYGVGSAEGLAEQLKEDPKTILVYDEFKTFVSKCGIEASTLLQTANSLFDLNHFHSRTRGQKLTVEAIYLSLLAASTIETFSRMFAPNFMDIGFINRLWLVPGEAEKRHAIPAEVPSEKVQSIAERLRRNLKLFSSQVTLDIDPDAHEVYQAWYLSEANRDPYAKRLDAYALRFMEIFAVNEGTLTVSWDMVERIVSLLEWERKVRQVCDPIIALGTIPQVENSIRRHLLKEGPSRERDLKKAAHTERCGLYVYERALGNLQRAREVCFNEGEQTWFLIDPEG